MAQTSTTTHRVKPNYQCHQWIDPLTHFEGRLLSEGLSTMNRSPDDLHRMVVDLQRRLNHEMGGPVGFELIKTVCVDILYRRQAEAVRSVVESLSDQELAHVIDMEKRRAETRRTSNSKNTAIIRKPKS